MTVANLVTRGIGPGSSIGDLVTAGFASSSAPATYSAGVYYFPGWSTPGGGPFASDPWSVIPSDRRPLVLGAYDETQQSVCDQQLSWMKQYGITFVAIDWFMQWSGTTLQQYLNHFVELYKTSVISKPKFCLQFANQTNYTGLNATTAHSVYDYWIANYFNDPNYYKIGGKPVVIINSGPYLRNSFTSHAEVKSAFLDAGDAAAVTAGYSGIYWMDGQADSTSAWTSVSTATNGWDGVTGSNVYSTTKNDGVTLGPVATTYAGLAAAVTQGDVANYHGFVYGWLAAADVNAVWPPLTAGFDNTPWNPSTTIHGMPTSGEWGTHLATAKAQMDANAVKTQLIFMIEAWNEFGEGSILCPTAGNGGFDRLQQLATTFSLPIVLAFNIQASAVAVHDTYFRVQFAASGTNPITYAIAVVANNASAPSAANVLAGTVSGAIASLTGQTANSGEITTSGNITGLSASTAYDVYVAIDDTASSPVLGTKIDMTTAAASGGGVIGTVIQSRARSTRRYPTKV